MLIRKYWEEKVEELKNELPKPMVLTCELVQKDKNNQGFSLEYAGGVLSLTASSIISGFQGLNLVRVAVKSAHMGDYLGDYIERFSWRPLWLRKIKSLDELPVKTELELMCQRLLSLGYNSIMLNCEFESDEKSFSLLDVFHAYGIKVILRFVRGANNMDKFDIIDKFNQSIRSNQSIDSNQSTQSIKSNQSIEFNKIKEINQKFNTRIDAIFWEGTFHQASRVDLNTNDLHIDIAKDEVNQLEKVIQPHQTLIYYIPETTRGQSDWFPQFCDEVGNRTVVSFSAVSDSGIEHPFWEILRRDSESSSTQLMPIINLGSIGCGEGLWPTVDLSSLERFFPRMGRHRFAGSIVMTATVPRLNAMLACGLWCANQLSFSPQVSSEMLVESWVASFKSHWNGSLLTKHLREISQISIDLSMYGKERGITRVVAENILHRLKGLESQASYMKPHITFFSRDIRRTVFYLLQESNISMMNVLTQDDLNESFWTAIGQVSEERGVAGAKVALLERPNCGRVRGELRGESESGFSGELRSDFRIGPESELRSGLGRGSENELGNDLAKIYEETRPECLKTSLKTSP